MNAENPLVSIIIPLYNKADQIAHTLECAHSQSFQDWEAIVVDDGSTDGSAEEVRKFADPRIRMVLQKNAGVSAARNRGVAEARGEYVAFLDADDEWKPEYLTAMMELARQYPECAVLGSNYEFRNPDGEVSQTILNRLPFKGKCGVLTNYFEVASCSHPPLWTSAVIVRTIAIREIGGFPTGIRSGEDLLTWVRLVLRNKVAYSMQPLAIYNLGEGYDRKNRPPRRQDAGDPVGKELKALYYKNPNVPGFRKYLSLWHKMRASVAIRYDENWETISESFKSLKFNPANFKVMPFIVLALMPKPLRHYVIGKYKG